MALLGNPIVRTFRRAVLVAIVVPLFAGGAEVSAQALESCAARAAQPSIGAVLSGAVLDVRVKSTIIAPGRNEEVVVRRGVGLSAIGEVPISPRFGLRVDLGRSRLGIVRQTVGDPNQVDVTTVPGDGSVALSHLTVGIVRHALNGRRLCGYAAAAAGLYRFSYRGNHANDVGIAGTLGFEIPASPKASVLLELQMNVVNHRSRPPFAAEAIFMFKAAAGARFRF